MRDDRGECRLFGRYEYEVQSGRLLPSSPMISQAADTHIPGHRKLQTLAVLFRPLHDTTPTASTG
jgi:hypothetical protein